MTKNIDIIRSLEIEPLARFLAEVAEGGEDMFAHVRCAPNCPHWFDAKKKSGVVYGSCEKIRCIYGEEALYLAIVRYLELER